MVTVTLLVPGVTWMATMALSMSCPLPVPVRWYRWLREHCRFFLLYVAMDQHPDLLARLFLSSLMAIDGHVDSVNPFVVITDGHNGMALSALGVC
jgi:hypothetical protein